MIQILRLFLKYLFSELQKDYFCPVSQLSTEKCQNHAFGEFCNNMRHKSKLRLVFYSFIVFLS